MEQALHIVRWQTEYRYLLLPLNNVCIVHVPFRHVPNLPIGVLLFESKCIRTPILVRTRFFLRRGSLPPLTAFISVRFLRRRVPLGLGCNSPGVAEPPTQRRSAYARPRLPNLQRIPEPLYAVSVWAHGFTTGLTSVCISSRHIPSDLQTSEIGGYPAGAAVVGARMWGKMKRPRKHMLPRLRCEL